MTVGGLLAASAVTLTGAYGEIWVLYRSGRRLDLGSWENRVVVLAVLAAILLTFYSYRTLLATLRHGTTPHRLPPSDAIRAARMIVAALQAHGDIDADELDRAIARTTKAAAAEGPAGAMRAPRSPRSALL